MSDFFTMKERSDNLASTRAKIKQDREYLSQFISATIREMKLLDHSLNTLDGQIQELQHQLVRAIIDPDQLKPSIDNEFHTEGFTKGSGAV